MLDLAVFVPRLKQVIAWTEHLMQSSDGQNISLNNSKVFRGINPVIDGQPLYIFNRDNAIWSVDWSVHDYAPDKYEQALQAAIEQREVVKKQDLSFLDSQKLGRIIYLETEITTCDGAAEFQTNGFIDGSDVPPIDTWFYLDQNIQRQARKVPNLFCWIPKRFEPIMQEAISVEIFGSYHWLDEEGPLTHQQIVAAMSA